jgi:hypothetical protein
VDVSWEYLCECGVMRVVFNRLAPYCQGHLNRETLFEFQVQLVFSTDVYVFVSVPVFESVSG